MTFVKVKHLLTFWMSASLKQRVLTAQSYAHFLNPYASQPVARVDCSDKTVSLLAALKLN